MSKNLITSLCWVRKSHMKKIPDEFTEESKINEMKEVETNLKNNMKNLKLTGNETIKEETKILEGNLENNEDLDFDDIPVFSSDYKSFFQNDKNKDDKYPEGFDELSEEEQEDYTIHPTDNLIVCSSATEDISLLEVYIYDESKQNLFVHHDIQLSSYPICLEWLALDQENQAKANFVVVGTFLPEIEIWNLDSLDALEPECVLGDYDDSKPKDEKYYTKIGKKKNQEKNPHETDYHTDAVLAVSLNPFDKNILASGSADSKLILWDVLKAKPLRNIREHYDKVQSVRYNPCEDNVLLSGGSDNFIKIFDVKSNSSMLQVNLNSGLECVEWSTLNKYKFVVSMENGFIEQYDIRNLSSYLTSHAAHKKAATSVSYSRHIDDLYVSTSLDCHVKVWDAQQHGKEPNLISEKFLKKTTGELFCGRFSDDVEHTVAVGGSKGELFIWQLEESKTFCDRYNLKWFGDDVKLSDEVNNLAKKKIMSNRLKLKSNSKTIKDKSKNKQRRK